MTHPWHRGRRRRYAARAHQIETRPAPSPTPEPTHTSWKVRPGELVAHAFPSNGAWMRSVCRRERWTVVLEDAPEAADPCGDCALLVDGAPGEIMEAFGR